MNYRLTWLPLIGVVLGAATGCGGAGDTGPPRHSIQGAVTVDGTPVPAGEITFEPDGAKGNNGPMTIANIEDGRYQTPDDKGVVGGAYLVRVTAYKVKPPENDPHAGRDPMTGSPYFVEKMLPDSGGELDLALLASDSAAKKGR